MLKGSGARRLWLIVGSLLAAVCGLGVVVFNLESFWAWAGVLIFGVGLAIFVIQLVRPDTLTLARDGFSYRSLGRSMRYAWADVAEFGVLVLRVQGGTTRQVGIRMKTPGGTLARRMVSGLSGRFDGALPDNYGLPVEELVALLEEWRVAAARSSA